MKRLDPISWRADLPRAFTRLDLLLTLTGLALLMAVTWPALAHTKPRADLAVCANNLRLIGRGEQIWASEHGDYFPWRVPYSGSTEDGTQGAPLDTQLWYQYSFMSNDLVTPRILACPSDVKTTPASDWSTSPEGGFLNAIYRNNAASYFIGLDSYLRSTPIAFLSSDLAALGGDRHLSVDVARVANCNSGIRSTSCIYAPGGSRARWTNAIHGTVGNILLVDGRVSLTSTAQVARTITGSVDDNGAFHILLPR